MQRSVIANLWAALFSIHQRPSTPSDFFVRVFTFAKVARVLYLNMALASEQMQQYNDSLHTQIGSGNMTMDETLKHDDFPIRCRLSYIQFIEQLNRIGRVLKKSGHILPLYSRIYFFRNNLVEHWDRYLQFLSKGEGLLFIIREDVAQLCADCDLNDLHRDLPVRPKS